MKQEGDQSAFKVEVKQWLKSHGFDYKWMADQCGVSEITVRNWMSQKAIPPLKQQLIERVMVQMPTRQSASSPSSIPGVQVDASLSLTVKLSPELYAQLEAKATRHISGRYGGTGYFLSCQRRIVVHSFPKNTESHSSSSILISG